MSLDHDLKENLEIEKLQHEVKRLKRWYTDPKYYNVLITLIISLVTLIWSLKSGILDVKSERLKKEKANLIWEINDFNSKRDSVRKEFNSIKDSLSSLKKEHENMIKYYEDNLDSFQIMISENKIINQTLGIKDKNQFIKNVKSRLEGDYFENVQTNLIKLNYDYSKRLRDLILKYKDNSFLLFWNINNDNIEPRLRYLIGQGLLIIEDKDIINVLNSIGISSKFIRSSCGKDLFYEKGSSSKEFNKKILDDHIVMYFKAFTEFENLIRKKYKTIKID